MRRWACDLRHWSIWEWPPLVASGAMWARNGEVYLPCFLKPETALAASTKLFPREWSGLALQEPQEPFAGPSGVLDPQHLAPLLQRLTSYKYFSFVSAY